MSNGFLSQEEIDLLMKKNSDVSEVEKLTAEEIDILGEVGNIAMSTSATTLSTLLNRRVDITTPVVEIANFRELTEKFMAPYVLLQIKFEEGLTGINALLMNMKDAYLISNIMMGGAGVMPEDQSGEIELSEIELSAVSEAMNQMIGSASTAISTLLKKSVNIEPPYVQVLQKGKTANLQDISDDEDVAVITFDMVIEGVLESKIMQMYNFGVAKEIASDMMRDLKASMSSDVKSQGIVAEETIIPEENNDNVVSFKNTNQMNGVSENQTRFETEPKKENVFKTEFSKLDIVEKKNTPKNIEILMDVPLELTVVLGKTKCTINEILELGPGSIVELNKFAEEPLEIYVNQKLIAQGEVVIVDEKFGIKINNILNTTERVQYLK